MRGACATTLRASALQRCVTSWRGSLSLQREGPTARLRAVEPWRKLAEETVYARYRRVVSKRFELPNGEIAEYEIKDEDDMVAVLALTAARDVVLVRQFRPGPEALLLELPAGVIDLGAEPEETAAAELLEETGYAGRIEAAGTMLEEGYSNRRKFVFVAHECRREAEPEEPSLTEPVLLSLDELRGHLRSGTMADVDAGYLALDHLGLL